MYALLLELTALLTFWLCLGAWQEEGAAAGRRTFVALALSVFAWTAGVLARVEGLASVEQVHRIAMLGAIHVPGLASEVPPVEHAAPMKPLLALLFLSVLAGCGDPIAAGADDTTSPAADCCADGACCAGEMGGAAAKEGEVDVICAFSSDGRILAYDLLVLEDPDQAFPPYDAVLLISPQAAERGDVAEALEPLIGAVTDDTMRLANKQVDLDGASPEQAAAVIVDAANGGD